MDNLKKMREAVGGKIKQKPKDALFGQVATAQQPSPIKEEKAPYQRKETEEKLSVIYSERLQVPISSEQDALLEKLFKEVRKGKLINKGSLVRCLINLLKDADLPKGAASTETELEYILRQFLLGKGKS